MRVVMRTADQCLAKAAEMDGFVLSGGDGTADQYRTMALRWRQLAKQASWQDSFAGFSSPRL
jgi:hypothetical protein